MADLLKLAVGAESGKACLRVSLIVRQGNQAVGAAYNSELGRQVRGVDILCLKSNRSKNLKQKRKKTETGTDQALVKKASFQFSGSIQGDLSMGLIGV